MNLLAIDTATSTLSAALGAGDDVWYFEANAGLRHSELLMESIDILLKKGGIKPAELSGVLCMGGPGSFTGLRIGFATAKGLALSLEIPFAPVPTLDCMAWPFSVWPSLVIPAIDAKKNAFFCALYLGGKRLCPDMDGDAVAIAAVVAEAVKRELPPGAETPVLLVGPDAEKLRTELEPLLAQRLPGVQLKTGTNPAQGCARTLLEIAKERQLFENNAVDYFSGPQYIRKSDAELMSGNGERRKGLGNEERDWGMGNGEWGFCSGALRGGITQ